MYIYIIFVAFLLATWVIFVLKGIVIQQKNAASILADNVRNVRYYSVVILEVLYERSSLYVHDRAIGPAIK